MATIEFNMIITDEAVQLAREASLNPGWYLKPTKWAISSTSGELSVSRTTSSMFTTWINQPYSGVKASGRTGLLHSIVIPPDAYATEMSISEIYFIYKDYYDNEFLYAIAQPTTSLTFSPGVSQQYYFLFNLNNVTVPDTFLIEYTYPQDIDDHNYNQDAHEYLLKRDGSRTATGLLSYDTPKEITKDSDITHKQYVDNMDNILSTTLTNAMNTMKQELLTMLEQKANLSLSNTQPGSIFINQSVNWIMPDYSKGSDNKTKDTYHIAEEDGWISFNTAYYEDTSIKLYITYNGVENIFYYGESSSRIANTKELIIFPIPKGASYKIETGIAQKNLYLKFYPCIKSS